MPKKKSIIIATQTLVGPTPKDADAPFTLPAGEELTAASLKSLGLKKDDVTELLKKGTLAETEVREASATDDVAAVKDAEARAAAAEKDVADLEKQVEELEGKVEELEKKLAEATKDSGK